MKTQIQIKRSIIEAVILIVVMMLAITMSAFAGEPDDKKTTTIQLTSEEQALLKELETEDTLGIEEVQEWLVTQEEAEEILLFDQTGNLLTEQYKAQGTIDVTLLPHNASLLMKEGNTWVYILDR
ncbi:hypothetical protein AAG747_10550 [Rapidithrix thailandica]|uniref:Uncharacterized protein n=1 Tax=Rapidithrix thailandica TaxID=413964 RepID=A0AAW9S5X9_9BACT